MSNTRIKSIIVMAVLTLTMLIMGSFMDLAISTELFRGEETIVAMLGGFAGKLPAFLLLVFSFSILFIYVRTHKDAYKKAVRVLLYIAYVCAIMLAYLLAFYSAFEEITSHAKLFALAFATIATIITLCVISRTELVKAEQLKKWALLAILAIGIILVLTVALKELWGRYRFSSVFVDGESFTPWYIPNGPGGGHSLPSGHTALWGTLFLLIPLIDIYGYKGEGLAYALIIFTNVLVGIARIIGGYHYLTDVAISMIITFVVATLVMEIGYRHGDTLSESNIFRRI